MYHFFPINLETRVWPRVQSRLPDKKLPYWYDGYSDSLTGTQFSEEENCLHGMRMFLLTALIGVLEVAGDRVTASLRTSLQQLRD